MKVLATTAAAVALALAGAPCAQAQALYSNGPINGTINAYTINFGYAVTDSFTLTSTSDLQSVNFGVWDTAGDTATSVDWAITTAPFGGTTLFSGTSAVSSMFQYSNLYGYDINADTFSLGSLGLGAGTYYLELSNAGSQNGDAIYWDENNGPSTAYDSTLGLVGSESFTINGTLVAVPEPAALAIFILGLTAVVHTRRRRGYV